MSERCSCGAKSARGASTPANDPNVLSVSERDAVLRERKAFERGANAAYCEQIFRCKRDVADEARKRYPLPRVTRPRVVVDADGIQWRVVNGRLQYKRESADASMWTPAAGYRTREFHAKIAVLFDNPTEEVEADA